MKVLAGLVTQGSGSIGGMTMSKGKGGYYLRARTVPTNRKSVLQTNIRSGLAALAANWQTLTPTQIAAWNLYGKNVTIILDNGQHKKLSGFNWYVACNQLLLQVGDAPVTDGPTTFTLAGSPMIGAWGYAAPTDIALDITVLDPPSGANTGDQIMVFVGRPKTAGTGYFSGPWQYAGSFDTFDTTIATIIVDITSTPDYVGVAGQNQWIRVVRVLPDGRYSTPLINGPINAGYVDPYGITPNPFADSVAGTAGGTATATVGTGTISGTQVLATLPSGVTVTTSGPSTIVFTVAALTAPQVFSGIMKLSGSLGDSYLPFELTIT